MMLGWLREAFFKPTTGGEKVPAAALDWIAILTVLIAGLGASLFGLSILHDGGVGNPEPRNAVLNDAEFSALIASGNRIGEESAPVVVVVFNDYRCGFCSQLHGNLETLRRRYPQHLSVIYMHFVDTSIPSNRQYLIPLGTECAAEQGYFDAYHSATFSNRRVLDFPKGPWIIAEAAGIPDSVAFRRCMDSRGYSKRIRDQFKEGQRLGVRITPTLFLNGIPIIGSRPLEVLDSMIVMQFPR